MKPILTLPALFLITACAQPTPPPICNREAVEWNKWGTVEVPIECAPPVAVPPPAVIPPTSNSPDRPSTPDQPNEPKRPNEPQRPEPPTQPERPDPKPPSGPRGNNGLGNGDQSAPGNSGPHNRAENDNSGRAHPSGKPVNPN